MTRWLFGAMVRSERPCPATAIHYAGALPRTNEQHAGLVNKILLFSAWGQAGGAVVTPLVTIAVVV